MEQIMVSVLMPAYNHEKFISQAVQSVLSQECNFRYELLIHDDFSTDGTLAVAKKFAEENPEKIFLSAETQNQGLMKSYRKLMNQSRGKYIAILESDDFWTRNDKLQMQVDFLEANPDYALVATDIKNIFESIKKKGGGGKTKFGTVKSADSRRNFLVRKTSGAQRNLGRVFSRIPQKRF